MGTQDGGGETQDGGGETGNVPKCFGHWARARRWEAIHGVGQSLFLVDENGEWTHINMVVIYPYYLIVIEIILNIQTLFLDLPP